MANLLPTGLSFQRLDSFPLDSSCLHATLADAENFASSDPTAYNGQILIIIDARTQEEIDNNVDAYLKLMYIDNGTLKEIGSGESDITIDRGELNGSITVLPDTDIPSGNITINYDTSTGNVAFMTGDGVTVNYDDVTGDMSITGVNFIYNDTTGDLSIQK